MSSPVPSASPETPAPTRSPQQAPEHSTVNDKVAVWMTKKAGSMGAVYLSLILIGGWIALAVLGPLRTADPYPFPFLLFLGNVVQLLLVFVILVGQGVLGRSTDLRAAQTYDYAEAILHAIVEICAYVTEHAPAHP